MQVHEVLQDEFEGRDLFYGPILHVICSLGVKFLEPVTIQLPVSLGSKVVNVQRPSACRVRLFVLNSERETKEWVEFSDKLENPASYNGKVVKFKAPLFSR